MELSECLRTFRVVAGLSQRELGAACKPPYHPNLISKLEKGDRTLYAEDIPVLAEALGISEGDFYHFWRQSRTCQQDGIVLVPVRMALALAGKDDEALP